MTTHTTDNVTLDTEDGVSRLTITRPDVYNAMDTETTLDIRRALGAVQLDTDIDVLVVTGEGDDAFSSGADIAEHAGVADRQFQTSRIEDFGKMCRDFRQLHAPVVARINGHCVGGGLGIALYSDIRVGVEDAKFGIPPTKIGEIPSGGAVYRMVELIGETRTKDLLLTATLVDGTRAAEIGLIDRVVDRETLDAEVDSVVSSIQQGGSSAVKRAKTLVNEVSDATTMAEVEEVAPDLWWEQFDSAERERLVDEFLE